MTLHYLYIVEDEKDAERVLFSYGFGTSILSSTRHRIQQRYYLYYILTN